MCELRESSKLNQKHVFLPDQCFLKFWSYLWNPFIYSISNMRLWYITFLQVPREAGDFDTRQGLTKKPLTTSDQTSITITHSYINITTWFLKLLYRCHIDYKNWIEKSGPIGDHIRNSKCRVLDTILAHTGLNLDRCSSGGHGGTTTNGPQGRRFFSEEVIDTIRGLLSGQGCSKYQENILLLHRQLSTILSIVSSSRKVNLEKFKVLCDETSLNICDNFPWSQINHTLHGPLHHGVELISRNDGYGLGSLSEECLESNNKDIRNYLQLLSRKISPIAQVTDVMSRLLERSDPYILQLSNKSQPKKYCTECGATDHTIRSHSRLTSQPKKWYISLVEDLFLDWFDIMNTCCFWLLWKTFLMNSYHHILDYICTSIYK